MSRARRLAPWAALGLAAAGAAVVLAWSAWGGEDEVRLEPGEPPVAATAAVSPEAVLIGDRIVASLELAVNGTLTDADLVRVDARFPPLTRVAGPEVTRREAGEVTLLRYTFELQCVDQACLESARAGPLVVPKAIVTYPTAFGQGVSAFDWPAVRVGSRITATDLEDAAFRAGIDDPPAVGYRVAPTVLGWISATVAAVVVLTIGVLAVRRLRTLPAPEQQPGPAATEPEGTALAQALALVDGVSGGAETKRRVALEELASALEADGLPSLAPKARVLAWSRRPPASGEITEFAAMVRRQETARGE